MRKIYSIIVLLILISTVLDAQVILLRNKKSHKCDRLKQGDFVGYLLKDSLAIWKSGAIDLFDTTNITISGIRVRIDNIAELKVARKNLNFTADGGMLILAGFLFPAISVFNKWINRTRLSLTKAQMIVVSSFFVTGFVLIKFATKRYVLGKKYVMIVIPYLPQLNILPNAVGRDLRLRHF